jgi:hypothetical protein
MSKEWFEVVNRRDDELISGKVQGIPFEEVLCKARQKIEKIR